MKTIVILFALIISLSSFLSAQEDTVKDAEFKVFGNCASCKSRIEKSLKIKEVKSARWNKQTKILSVAYLSPSITLDSLQQRIAAVGHDTEKYKAADSVYAELPSCCLYRDAGKSH
ncbi:MAG: heavy metal-associated domain-containing protein [Bacteroidota bacterium]|jgi:cation transport ATPase